MGYVARSQVDTADLWRAALGSLTAKTSETSLVLRRIGDAAVCVERAESDHPVRLSFEIGRAMPLHTGAGAKVLLAHSPAELQENYVDGAVVSARRQALRDELARIRSRGYGESSGEVDPGIWAVAAPVLAEGHGQHLAISVALPQYRLDRARRIVLRDATLEAAAELRRRLAAFA
jgi:DNA-binding IclR family transcriptional regulator